MDRLRGPRLVRTIDKLDGARTKADDQMMPVWQRSSAQWVGVYSGDFLGRAQVARWVAMVCMAKNLLHRRTGGLAQVYVHFLWWLWHVPNRCPGHQCLIKNRDVVDETYVIKLIAVVGVSDWLRSSCVFVWQNPKKTKNQNLYGFELHRPSNNGTKLLFQTIKAIINHFVT